MISNNREALEGAAHFLGSLNFGLTLLGDLANGFLIESSGFCHKKSDRPFVHEGSTDFIQLFEIGTQSLVSSRSCATGDGDVISFLGCGDFLFTNALNLESGAIKGLADGSTGNLGLFSLGGHECSHAGKHHLVDSLNFRQSHTGLVGSASPTTGEGYAVSLDARCGDFFSRCRGRESGRGHCSEGTHDAEFNFCVHSG